MVVDATGPLLVTLLGVTIVVLLGWTGERLLARRGRAVSLARAIVVSPAHLCRRVELFDVVSYLVGDTEAAGEPV